jgi:hypothetical protein
MRRAHKRRASKAGPNPYERNAQHGQNRAGVEVQADLEFEDFEGQHPIDPAAADARERDEGPEIRARVHARGHDVTDKG